MSTMSDVAKRAGVSLSTVSYVLSGKRAISEPTRQRVLAAIDELDFHPNQLGRALASQRSNTIALLFPALARGIGETATRIRHQRRRDRRQARVQLSCSRSRRMRTTRSVHLARRGFTDGLILMEIKLQDARAEFLRHRRFPFAMIGHREDNDGISFVDVDFVHAAREALRYLAGLGHRRVAFLGAPIS